MSTITIKLNIVLSNNNEIIQKMSSMFNNDDLVSINIDNNYSSITQEAIHKAKQNNKTKKYNFESWKTEFKPIKHEYSDKAILLKPTINNNKISSEWNIIKLPNNKNLYYNKTLKSWITSKSNDKLLRIDQKHNYVLNDFKYIFYKNGILLKAPTGYDVKNKLYFYDGYWNKTLQGWVFSKNSEIKLKEKGAVMVKNF